eukprot:TRINITY_DN14489_c0_g1_i1.p1 TRINITY_DN14489_c0_g1~~TRINITY_DN14489_c0_g1_i1.p1  ORF type:complete len:374 (+),score=15.53 TRINITY_DN14489_c0_g1_i1:168-1289(+)
MMRALRCSLLLALTGCYVATSQPAPRIRWRNVPGTTTYLRAQKLCQSRGLALCPSQAICPGGVVSGGARPGGDNWVAIADEYNDWISVGAQGSNTCKRHTQVAKFPNWGRKSWNVSYRKLAACCSPKLTAKIRWSKVSDGKLSYSGANKRCKRAGMSLCTRDEICGDDNTPKGRVLPLPEGDSWVAVKDSVNEWVNLGRGGWSCKKHSEVDGGRKPGWGQTTIAKGYRKLAACCNPRKSPYDCRDWILGKDLDWCVSNTAKPLELASGGVRRRKGLLYPPWYKEDNMVTNYSLATRREVVAVTNRAAGLIVHICSCWQALCRQKHPNTRNGMKCQTKRMILGCYLAPLGTLPGESKRKFDTKCGGIVWELPLA